MRSLDSMRKTSSANRLITCSLELNLKPVTRECECILSAKGSIIKLKIVGDNRQPFRVPLDIWNGLDRNPGGVDLCRWGRV